jgi:hypothetical protein
VFAAKTGGAVGPEGWMLGLDGFRGVSRLFPYPNFAKALVITLILSELHSLLLTPTFVTFILDIRYYWCDNS